jgi:DNA-binding NarL/FixJ family response regulator
MIIGRIKDLLSDLPGLGPIRDAGSYAEALSLLSTPPLPDLLLLDINLPDRNGIELLRYVRRHYPGILVIMLSNQSSVFYRDLCARLGAAHYIDKSTEFELVPTIIASHLKESL